MVLASALSVNFGSCNLRQISVSVYLAVIIDRQTQFMMDGRTKRDPKQFSNSESIIEHADELFHSGGVDVVYEYLSSFVETLQDPDILWRFGRACGVMYKFLANDKQSRIKVVQRGLDALECALKINDKSSHILHVSCLLYIIKYE